MVCLMKLGTTLHHYKDKGKLIMKDTLNILIGKIFSYSKKGNYEINEYSVQKKARKCIKKAGGWTNSKNQAGERISAIFRQEHNYPKTVSTCFTFARAFT